MVTKRERIRGLNEHVTLEARLSIQEKTIIFFFVQYYSLWDRVQMIDKWYRWDMGKLKEPIYIGLSTTSEASKKIMKYIGYFPFTTTIPERNGRVYLSSYYE